MINHTDFSSSPLVPSQTNATTAPKEHLGVLDMLRGFAAISVVLYHFTYGLPTLGKSDGGGTLVKFASLALKSMFSWGHMGVEVFFVISGFVIPYSLWNAHYQLRNFSAYMLKRILRICPPAYLVIALVLLQWFVVDNLMHPVGTNSYLSAVTPQRLLGNLFFLYKYADSRWIIGVFWTLAVEFQFYIVIGLLFNYLFKTKNIVWFVLLFTGMALFNYIPHFPTYTFFHYSPLFALGGITLLYYKNQISLLSFLLISSWFFGLGFLMMPFVANIFGLATAMLIAFVRVRHSVFSFFGKISFSLYLTHVVVGSTSEFLLAKFFPPHTQPQHIFGIFLITIISCLFAYGYFYVVEKPTLRLIKLVS